MQGSGEMSWKLWMIFSTVAWTLWGIMVKIALKYTDWARLEALSAVIAVLVMLAIAPRAYRWEWEGGDIYALVAAFLGVGGVIFFYLALSRGPASVVIPITSLYIVGASLFGMIALGETFSWKKVGGVALALLAIALLSSEN